MTRHSALWFGGAALLALAAVPALSQQSAPTAPGFVPQPTPTADKLAAAMSTLGRSPQDVEALIAAGEASAALDDTPAALQFLARAEKLRPADPRIPAARGRAFVRMGRPGEALRRFADAERGGLAPTTYADDRGLAYDLVGDQAHAQLEYNRALAVREDAEVRRRLAISQAISGDQPGAEKTLDPLLRQQDRASWRTKALVMALGGNTTGAERVTATMMPGFSTAYLPLFRRLSEIRDPADRAFAAHLGEFTRTPARLADASLAPAAPPLPQPAPVRVAAASVPPPAATRAPTTTAPIKAQARPTRVETASAEASADTRARARERRALERRAERDALMAERYGRRPRRVETAADTRRPPAATSTLPVGRTALPTVSASLPTANAPLPTGAVSTATAAPNPAPSAASTLTPASSPVASAVVATMPAPTRPESTVTSAAAGLSIAAPAAPAVSPTASPPSGSGVSAAPAASVGVSTPMPATATPAPVMRASEPVVAAAPSTATPGFSTTDRPPTVAPAPATRPIGREDDVLAMIVRNIAVPANELGVSTPPAAIPPATEPAPTQPVAAARPSPTPAPKTSPERAPVPAAPATASKKPAELNTPAAKKGDPKAAEAKEAKKREAKLADAGKADLARANGKKADTKKADLAKADPKKGDAKKGETTKPEPKKGAEPARWWVQVAGGANVADLPKAWNALTAKNPALKKRQAWTTPLRFTNRLLTGPFASSGEAQAYVNTLGKDGLSAFAFQSEAGQKVTRLPAK